MSMPSLSRIQQAPSRLAPTDQNKITQTQWPRLLRRGDSVLLDGKKAVVVEATPGRLARSASFLVSGESGSRKKAQLTSKSVVELQSGELGWDGKGGIFRLDRAADAPLTRAELAGCVAEDVLRLDGVDYAVTLAELHEGEPRLTLESCEEKRGFASSRGKLRLRRTARELDAAATFRGPDVLLAPHDARHVKWPKVLRFVDAEQGLDLAVSCIGVDAELDPPEYCVSEAALNAQQRRLLDRLGVPKSGGCYRIVADRFGVRLDSREHPVAPGAIAPRKLEALHQMKSQVGRLKVDGEAVEFIGMSQAQGRSFVTVRSDWPSPALGVLDPRCDIDNKTGKTLYRIPAGMVAITPVHGSPLAVFAEKATEEQLRRAAAEQVTGKNWDALVAKVQQDKVVELRLAGQRVMATPDPDPDRTGASVKMFIVGDEGHEAITSAWETRSLKETEQGLVCLVTGPKLASPQSGSRKFRVPRPASTPDSPQLASPSGKGPSRAFIDRKEGSPQKAGGKPETAGGLESGPSPHSPDSAGTVGTVDSTPALPSIDNVDELRRAWPEMLDKLSEDEFDFRLNDREVHAESVVSVLGEGHHIALFMSRDDYEALKGSFNFREPKRVPYGVNALLADPRAPQRAARRDLGELVPRGTAPRERTPSTPLAETRPLSPLFEPITLVPTQAQTSTQPVEKGGPATR